MPKNRTNSIEIGLFLTKSKQFHVCSEKLQRFYLKRNIAFYDKSSRSTRLWKGQVL